MKLKDWSLIVLGKGKHRRVVYRNDANRIVKQSKRPKKLALNLKDSTNPQRKRIAALKSLAMAS